MKSSRRGVLAALAAGAVGTAGGTAAIASLDRFSPGSSRFDWPMARYDPQGTGHHPEASGPREDVVRRWTADAPGWFRGRSTPIRLGDTLYAAGGGVVAVSTDGDRRFAQAGPYASSLARAESGAYATPTLAVTGRGGVAGVNAGGGLDIPLLDSVFDAARWTGPFESGHSLFGSVRGTTPVAAGDSVYVTVPGTSALVALDGDSGDVRWRRRATVGGTSAAFNRPAVRDDVVFATAWPHLAVAYRADTGEQVWRRELDEQMVLAPVATPEGVVVLTRSSVRLLDLQDGTPRWRRDIGANATDGAPAVANGTVYVGDGTEGVHALSLSTGETEWRALRGREVFPVVADGVLYFRRTFTRLSALDATTGDHLFDYPSAYLLSRPIVGDGLLYTATSRGLLALGER